MPRSAPAARGPAEDFPGETFRVLKQKEGEFGEYCTRRLVMEAWERQERR